MAETPPLVADFREVTGREYDGEDVAGLARVGVDGAGMVVGVVLAPETVRRSAAEVAAAVSEAITAARGKRVKAIVDMGLRHGIAPREDVR